MNTNVKDKKIYFSIGLKIFFENIDITEEAYNRLMSLQNGYVSAAKQFYEKSCGYMTSSERDLLFKQDIVPDWMMDEFQKYEKIYFSKVGRNNG